MSEPGSLQISVTKEAEVEASAVRFHVSVEGERMFLGNAAFEKSKVIRDLVQGLQTLGAAEKDISIESVSAQSSSGIFKDSKCLYQLAIRLDDLSKVGEYFGLLAASPVKSSNIEWIFEVEEVKTELACQALAACKAKAERMAHAVAHVVTGIEVVSDSQQFGRAHIMAGEMAMIRSRAQAVDIGMEFQSRETVSVEVSARFTIEPATN